MILFFFCRSEKWQTKQWTWQKTVGPKMVRPREARNDRNASIPNVVLSGPKSASFPFRRPAPSPGSKPARVSQQPRPFTATFAKSRAAYDLQTMAINPEGRPRERSCTGYANQGFAAQPFGLHPVLPAEQPGLSMSSGDS